MADSLCGPSNALQSFQKHSTADRTLQQDRLTSRNVTSQGFRSAGLSTSVLDPEFEAFQAGQIPLPHLEGMGFGQEKFPNTPQQMQHPNSPAWANDFQRMNISGPPAHFQQQHFSQQPQQSNMGGWHQEFARQHKQYADPSQQNYLGYNAPLERLSSLAHMPSTPQGFQMPQNFQMFYSGPLNAIPDQSQQHAQPMTVEAFDEEAFARAFDDAAKSELVQTDLSQTERLSSEGQDILLNESAERLMGPEISESRERIGADLIHDPDQETRADSLSQNDPDALARTAGELLHSVKDNQSEKFQNSTFLSLMRQLRDKEVAVEGDKIVDVGTYTTARPENQDVVAP